MSGTLLPAEILVLWRAALSPLVGESDAADAACLDMMRRYHAPSRHYHTLDHVRQVANAIQMLFAPNVFEDPDLYLAALLHDVIYDPRAKDNEERSAEYAHELLASLGVERAVRDEVARLILLTKRHETSAKDRPGQMLLDADLFVLGENESAYDAYAAAIRREYDWVSD